MKQRHAMGYLYILGTVFFTVYGQLIIKWQTARAGALPAETSGKMWFLVRFILNPWVLSSLTAAFLAFLCWVGALSNFDLSYAYPFTSLSFLLVLGLSALFFGEEVTLPKVLGMALVVTGVIIGSRGG